MYLTLWLNKNMADPTTNQLSAAFAALADPTRRAILATLARGDMRVGDLNRPFAISGPAISRHLQVLEKARLIERRVDAQWRVCRLHPPGLQAANDWLAPYRHFWDQSLDRLVEVLEQDGPADSMPAPPEPAAHAATKPRTRPAPSRQPSKPQRKKP